MMKVFHACKPTFGVTGHRSWPDEYELVAQVIAEDDPDTAFTLTQHLDDPWWEQSAVERVIDRDVRSTSVGDVVVLSDGRAMRVEDCGWHAVNGVIHATALAADHPFLVSGALSAA